MATLSILAANACTVPSRFPDGSVPQVPPIGMNGMAEEPTIGNPTVWAADFFGRQLLRFEPATGAILERHGSLCDTDDVVVTPHRSLIATCPGEGTVIRMTRDGSTHVLATVGTGVNPIALDPSGTSVVVGFGTGDRDDLLRVPLGSGPVEVVADGLPALNGFGFGPDGHLYAPSGGPLTLLFGNGGVVDVDVRNGTIRELPLHFDDPDKTGFAFPVGVDVAQDSTIVVAQASPPAVYQVDPRTGEASLLAAPPLPFADNLLVLDDGRIVVSGFLGRTVAVLSERSDGAWSTELLDIGA